MKPQYLFLLTLSIFAFCFFSCEKVPTQPETPEVPADTTEIPTDTTEIIIPEIYPKVIETINYFLPDSSNNWIRPHWEHVKQYAVKTIDYAYLYAVNSQEELGAILENKQSLPVIDFDKYTLMRLHTDWSTENNVSYSYTQTGENTYTVDVEITGLPALPRHPYTPQNIPVFTHFLVPKLPEDAIFELDVTRNMNLDGWRVVKHEIDIPATVVEFCFDIYAITGSFSLVLENNYGLVCAYNVPKECQISGLPVIVSGKIHDYPGLNKCGLYNSQASMKLSPGLTRMFHIDSIKPKPVEP